MSRMRRSLILLASLFSSLVWAQTQAFPDVNIELVLTGTKDYELFYIDYPENVTSVSLGASGSNSNGKCRKFYLYASPFGYPCGQFPSTLVNNTIGDPCYRSTESTVFSENGGGFSFSPGSIASTPLGSAVVTSGGRLFFQVAKSAPTDSCERIRIFPTFSYCPGSQGLDNGIIVQRSDQNYFNEHGGSSSTPTAVCTVHTDIELAGNVPLTIALNKSQTNTVFKMIMPQNTAYINISIDGKAEGSGAYFAFYASSGAPVNAAPEGSGLICFKRLYTVQDTVVKTSLTCLNTIAGPYYLSMVSDSAYTLTGNLSINAITCPEGTAPSHNDYSTCSDTYFFDASPILSTGSVSTVVATGKYITGWIDLSPQIAGTTLEFNHNISQDATGFFYISRNFLPLYSQQYFRTNQTDRGLTFDARFDTYPGTTLLTLRYFLMFYCSSGPCTFTANLKKTVPIITTSQLTTSALTTIKFTTSALTSSKLTTSDLTSSQLTTSGAMATPTTSTSSTSESSITSTSGDAVTSNENSVTTISSTSGNVASTSAGQSTSTSGNSTTANSNSTSSVITPNSEDFSSSAIIVPVLLVIVALITMS